MYSTKSSFFFFTAHGLDEMSPGSCCFRFFPKRIPKSHIFSITKTHSRCPEKAFVFNTTKGQICVSQTLDWARNTFNDQ
uniref:C-C motif chemokine 4 homolog n=1 Tax=Mastacembelus armatus TaxID=205130 RepID=A0A7N8WV47_9TELE